MPDKTVTRELLCKLSEAELRERGAAMAAAELRADVLKAERRRLNASIREQTDERNRLAQAIDARQELREVVCEWSPDYKRKRWALMRTDLKIRLPEELEMTPEDLQTKLPGVVDEPPKKKGAAKRRATTAKKRAA